MNLLKFKIFLSIKIKICKIYKVNVLVIKLIIKLKKFMKKLDLNWCKKEYL